MENHTAHLCNDIIEEKARIVDYSLDKRANLDV